MPAVVLFDGVCNLCNSAVDFIIARDPDGYFRFASLQSSFARTLLGGSATRTDGLDSIVLVEEGRLYTRSAAALRIARRLRGPWRLLYGLIVLPAPLGDALYAFVARNRYRWFGRRQACRAPSERLRALFLD